MDIVTFKTKFDPYLRRYATEQSRHYISYTSNPLIRSMFPHTLKLLFRGGKRVRPYVIDVMYRSAGGKESERLYPIFVAIEVFHCFCLIHDDVMDRGTERHGVETMHCFVADKMKSMDRIGEIAHVADAQAVLMGDLLFALACRIFYADHDIPGASHRLACTIFERMIDEVIIGQMIDIDSTTQRRAPLDEIINKMRLKTARYTFVGPMQIGLAMASSHNKRLMQFCEAFGTALGIAFQIQDDLLDITTPPQASEKTVLSDIQQCQHTVFTDYILDKGAERHKKQLHAMWEGRQVSQEEVLQLFSSSGSIAHGEQLVQTYLSEAKELLRTTSIAETYKGEWYALIDYIEKRSS